MWKKLLYPLYNEGNLQCPYQGHITDNKIKNRNLFLLTSSKMKDVTNQLLLSRADILEVLRPKHVICACTEAAEECCFDLKMSLRKVCKTKLSS